MKNLEDMSNLEASYIIGNIPITGEDECYTIPEYQHAKAMAVAALLEKHQLQDEPQVKLNADAEGCHNCTHCIPCKCLINNQWKWFKICEYFAHEKDGWCVVVQDNNVCESFNNKR